MDCHPSKYSNCSSVISECRLIKDEEEQQYMIQASKDNDEVMKEIFPIANYTENYFVDYHSCELKEPKHTFLECKAHGYTYSAQLYAELALRSANGDGQSK